MAKTLLQRFNEKYIPEPNSGCWLWTGALHSAGYGVINRGERGKGTDYAHRVSYEAHVGPIPERFDLDHKCRTPCCVNPDHLEAVTHKENVRRGHGSRISKARFAAKTHCIQGHEYTRENSYFYTTSLGYSGRQCRQCQRDRRVFQCSA